jgi:hypothetical protein
MNDKKIKKQVEHKKYERSYVYDDCTIIWKYDNLKSISGPYEVEIKHPKKRG